MDIEARLQQERTRLVIENARLVAENARLKAEIARLKAAARDFLDNHSLDCGAHYCRYCCARSPEWSHEPYCAYVRSQSAYTALWAAVTAAPAGRVQSA